MKPFWLYTDIRPALDRLDAFLATTTYAAEPEPHRDLLHFPNIDPGCFPLLARRIHYLKGGSRIIPPLLNLGLHDGRDFLAYGLGPMSTAPTLRPLRGPVPDPFWRLLLEGLRNLHSHGFTYGRLAADTVARTDRGEPMLFDLTALRSVEGQRPDVDLAAFRALRERYD
jgi:hypothetical protein